MSHASRLTLLGQRSKIHRCLPVVIGLALLAPASSARTARPASLTRDGWTITVDPQQHTLDISHGKLGAVLENVRLNVKCRGGLRPLNNWSVAITGRDQIFIRTAAPRISWLVRPGPTAIRISSTSSGAVLTAEAPAPPTRIVARLLDTEGTPVKWMMTAEMKKGYGGIEASDPSFLPRRNPDVMHFALGEVAGANLHSLFDRETDTAISFSEGAVMRRKLRNPDLLDVRIPVQGNTSVRLLPDYFTRVLGLPGYVPFDDSYFRRAPMVWDSWSNYYEQVQENDIVRNTDWLAANLKPYGYQYVQLDDGYDRGKHGEHYWIKNWDQAKFPHGPKWLAGYIKSKGLLPGIWLVPNASAGAVEQHPSWYLYYKKSGKIVLDYSTPTLDPTNPDVLNFLQKEFTILDNWGFEYYKFDGEHDFLRYVPGIDPGKIANRAIDPIAAYHRRLKVIRETVGPHRFIEGCPAGGPLDGIGYFNSYFTGADPYNSWRGMYPVFSSLNANAFLNHIVVYVMPGEMDVEPSMTVAEAIKRRPYPVVATAREREKHLYGLGTTLAEAHTVLSWVSLSGVVYSLGSVVAELPPQRAKLLQMTLPTMPILPIDLFSRGTDMPMWDIFKRTTPDDYIHNYPEILDLKVNEPAGVYDVAGLINWRNWPAVRNLSFAGKLGLNPNRRYVVFDFWGQQILGVFTGKMCVTIAPHDTRVLLIHPLLNRPQLAGTSRHITGAYSIKELAWDGSANSLRGRSQTVPGADYTLWIYVPDGLTVSTVRANTLAKAVLPVRHDLLKNSLKVTFAGQRDPVDWVVKFEKEDTR